jgi:hypothetical protein
MAPHAATAHGPVANGFNDLSNPFVVYLLLPRFQAGARGRDYELSMICKAGSGQATWNKYSKRTTMTTIAAPA